MSKKYIPYIKPALQGSAVLLFAILLGIWAGSNPAIPASVPETETESESKSTIDTRPSASADESETDSHTSKAKSETEPESSTDGSKAETEPESSTGGSEAGNETESDTSAGTETGTKAGSENESQMLTEGESESESETETEEYHDIKLLPSKGAILRSDSENPLLPYSRYRITDDNADWFIVPQDFAEAYLLRYTLVTPDSKTEIAESSLSWKDLETILKFMTDSYEGTWSIYVKDLKNDRSISVNDQPMEAASLIKLYIMGAVYEQLGMSAIDNDLTISDALYNMITVSDNESANILVRALDPDGEHSKGMVKVNNFIREYGFTNTEQVNGLADPSLWSDDGRLNKTSAKDCGTFLEYVYRGEMVSHLASRDMESLLLGQEIDYKIPDSLPSEVVSASKTGEVEGCENDTAIVYSPGGDYIICIMSNGWSDDAAAVSRIHSLSEAVYAFFNPGSGYTITLPSGPSDGSGGLSEYSTVSGTDSETEEINDPLETDDVSED